MTEEELAWAFAPEPIEGDVIITNFPLLGLGDIAVYSTLPERFSKLGHDVYLHVDSAASNQDIYDLFWRMNPYIKGLTDRKPNAGYARQGLIYLIANSLPGFRGIEAVEKAHALPPPYSMAPKLYYPPKPFHIDLSEKVIIDFASVSSSIGNRGLTEAIKSARYRFKNPDFVQVLFDKHIVLNAPGIASQSYQVSSIYEYLDMLHAAKAWIGSEAGGQSLASAVRGEREVQDEEGLQVVCTATPATFNSRLYTYRNVDYHVTCDTDTRQDYWDTLEVRTMLYENQCRLRAKTMESRLAG